MVRFVLSILLWSLSLVPALAQGSKISVTGQVRYGTKPVEEGIVALLHPSDSSILAYSMTDRQGRYSVEATTALSELLIRVTGFNIKRKLMRIKALSQTLDLSVEEESIVLRELVVKSRKLWGGRDTINYLVSAYTRGHDRTIGDILRQLPGITIEENNVIKYQGTPINHFYIENLDMLQGRYNLATQGIKAEDVATVQVLERHEHVRALQDQAPPEQAAINLKLKNTARGIWSRTARLGAGAYAHTPLWDASLQATYFTKSRQHLIRYSGNNLGQESDPATAHYGISSSGDTPPLVHIIKHGTSPVGKSLFGYRHGVNLNNLNKLSDSTTLTYNLHYGHLFSHGHSSSQTTYILPDASRILLVEDVADRTHTNTANLQLVYETNRQRLFLYNTLSLFGRWEEGPGTIYSQSMSSSSQPSASTIAQALHYRSLGLSNRTRLVHRTPTGGGIEWVSTNSLSSTPQILAIGGSRTARQRIDLTTISTANSLQLLRDLRSRRWTLSASAHLNSTYTALSSRLTHPDAPTAPRGNMIHVRTSADIGPVARYVHGSLQSTLSLPLALTYTYLDNASIPTERTDARRLRLYLQPSFTLQWRASDYFTFDASAGYLARETPWARLLSATLMPNYRSLSRYRATLNDSYDANAHLKVSYKDLFSGFFAHVEGGWRRSWSDIAYGTTLDAEARSVIEAVHQPNHSTLYTLSAYGRKDIDWHTMQLELAATSAQTESEVLRQATLTSYRTADYGLRGTLALDLITGYRLHYQANWRHNRSTSASYTSGYSELSQQARLDLHLIPSRLFLKLQASHTHSDQSASEQKDYLFVGAGLKYTLSKRVELELNGDNLTNTRTYIIRSLRDLEEHYTEYHLRPLSIVLTAHLYL